MAKIAQPSLFDWSQIEASSDLDRLSLVLCALPDEKIMQALEHRRYRGRNDYPVRPTWNALIAGIVFNHPAWQHIASGWPTGWCRTRPPGPSA